MSNYQEPAYIQNKRDEVREWVKGQEWYRLHKKEEDRKYYNEEGLENYKKLTGREFEIKDPLEDENTKVHF